MSDRERHLGGRHDRERDARPDDERGRPSAGSAEGRTWSSDDDDRDHRGRGASTPYGRPEGGSANASEGGHVGGGYGDQGGFGSQHGQGGYASPAQGSRYGQTGSEWGRSGYGSFASDHGGRDGGRSYGGGQSSGFGYPSYAAERDNHESRADGGAPNYGFRGQGGGGAQWGGRESYGEGGYGARTGGPGAGDSRNRYGGETGPTQSGGTYGQEDYGRSAQRSQARTDQNYGGDARGQAGASGQDHDHEPHYRRWRDQQLENHDRDYDRWRSTQARKYDDEYRTYRDTRHDSFSRDFGDWRDKNRDDTGSSSARDASAAAPKAGGFGTASPTAPSVATPAPTGATGGSALASSESLRNVSDGGSGARDHETGDKADSKTS